MATYTQIQFNELTADQSDLLIAELSIIGFEGFEEESVILKAFIPTESLDNTALQELSSKLQVLYTSTIIEETNWNAVWESNFSPVVVDDFVGIRADFHSSLLNVEHEIVITPKMSFGTGHHATTHLVLQQMRNFSFANKQVFDFGTGTGVLAILAEKLGANKVVAIDNDDWSIENATENANRNNCTKIVLEKAFDASGNSVYDIILANINKNVILDNMQFLSHQLNTGGTILFSGLLVEDEAAIKEVATNLHFNFQQTHTRNGWICMRFVK